MRPGRVEHALHVRRRGGGDEDGVLLGQQHDELAVRAVAPHRAVAAAPELEAVTLPPVRVGLGRVRRVQREGGLGPPLGQDLPPAVRAPVEVELAEAREHLRRQVQPGEGDVPPGGVLVPPAGGDAERLEQPRPQVVGQRRPRDGLQDGAQSVYVAGLL